MCVRACLCLSVFRVHALYAAIEFCKIVHYCCYVRKCCNMFCKYTTLCKSDKSLAIFIHIGVLVLFFFFFYCCTVSSTEVNNFVLYILTYVRVFYKKIWYLASLSQDNGLRY